jgi:hypothetical protein
MSLLSVAVTLRIYQPLNHCLTVSRLSFISVNIAVRCELLSLQFSSYLSSCDIIIQYALLNLEIVNFNSKIKVFSLSQEISWSHNEIRQRCRLLGTAYKRCKVDRRPRQPCSSRNIVFLYRSRWRSIESLSST